MCICRYIFCIILMDFSVINSEIFHCVWLCESANIVVINCSDLKPDHLLIKIKLILFTMYILSLKWLQRLFLCLGKVFVNFLMAKYLGSHMHNDVICYFFVYELCFVLCFEFLLFVKSPTFWYVKLNGLFQYWKKYRFFFHSLYWFQPVLANT